MSSTPMKLAAGVIATLAVLVAAGCATTTVPLSAVPAAAPVSSVPAAHSRGSVHLTAYSDNDGPTDTVIVTGAIGDYGKAVSVYPNGTVDPDHDSQLSLQLQRGTLRLDAAALDKAFVAAMLNDFPTNAATCSGSVDVTRQVPIVAGSGTGAYKGIGGAFTLTIALDEVDKASAGQSCDGSSVFLSQALVVSGPGSVAF